MVLVAHNRIIQLKVTVKVTVTELQLQLQSLSYSYSFRTAPCSYCFRHSIFQLQLKTKNSWGRSHHHLLPGPPGHGRGNLQTETVVVELFTQELVSLLCSGDCSLFCVLGSSVEVV